MRFWGRQAWERLRFRVYRRYACRRGRVEIVRQEGPDEPARQLQLPARRLHPAREAGSALRRHPLARSPPVGAEWCRGALADGRVPVRGLSRCRAIWCAGRSFGSFFLPPVSVLPGKEGRRLGPWSRMLPSRRRKDSFAKRQKSCLPVSRFGSPELLLFTGRIDSLEDLHGAAAQVGGEVA